MRNVITPTDPAASGGSLAGTMTAPVAGTPTVNTTATPAAAGTQAGATPAQDQPGDVPDTLSEDDWYQLLHNLGSAMKRANPDIEAALKQMSPDIDYEGQAAELRKKIEARKTTQPLPWYAAASASMTPGGERAVEQREQQAHSEEQQKQTDLEKLQENVTMQHIGDLQRRGKFQEALATMLLQRGLMEAGARTRAQELKDREKLRGENAVNAIRQRAQNLADTFHFDERMRLKLLDIAGKVASDKLQKYGGLNPVTGGFSIRPEQYETWQDETMGEIYRIAGGLRTGGGEVPAPEVGGTGVTAPGRPRTSQGKAAETKKDPLGLR